MAQSKSEQERLVHNRDYYVPIEEFHERIVAPNRRAHRYSARSRAICNVCTLNPLLEAKISQKYSKYSIDHRFKVGDPFRTSKSKIL